MITRFLSDEEICLLDRDLRILVATNGTLTRILGIVTGDEIVVQTIGQVIQPTASGRSLERQVVLSVRHSRKAFVAAESSIAVDLVRSELIDDLLSTDRPIGELMVASRLEFFKEAPEVWFGDLPACLARASQRFAAQAVARRYAIIIAGQPAIVITEHFLQDIYPRYPDDACGIDRGISNLANARHRVLFS
jgi:chorismate--pyruvate lyase